MNITQQAAEGVDRFALRRFQKMHELLDGKIRCTPLIYSDFTSQLTGHGVFLKAENLQVTNSFKIRSAFGGLLPRLKEARKLGVVTSSSGNFAQAIAYAGRELRVPITVVMMRRSAPNKVEKAKRLGAQIVFCTDDFAERLELVEKLSREEGKILVHSFDDPFTIQGNGSLGFELLKQAPKVDIVFVPTSGGGLLSGVSAVMKQSGARALIVGVQTEAVPSLQTSLEHGKPTLVPNGSTIADGLVATKPGTLNFELVKRFVDQVVLVSDREITDALKLVVMEDKLVVEPSAAAAVAGAIKYLNGKPQARRCNIVVVLTGGNIAADRLRDLVFGPVESTPTNITSAPTPYPFSVEPSRD